MADSPPTPEQIDEQLGELLNTTETVRVAVPAFAVGIARELAPQLDMTIERLLGAWIAATAVEIVLAAEPPPGTGDELPVQ